MDAQQQIFSLMTAVEDQQKAVEAALEGLAVERAALARDRAELVKAAAGLVAVAADVRRAAAEAVPAVQQAAGDAVGASVRQSLAGAAQAAASALSEATRPVIGSLWGVVKAASDAEGSMRRAGAWFAWKWVAVAAGGSIGVCLVAYALVLWQMHQFERLGEQKAALAAEVEELQANIAALEKRGGRIVAGDCGGRLCIEASSNQGKGAEQWKGAVWSNKEKGVQLVIPRGY